MCAVLEIPKLNETHHVVKVRSRLRSRTNLQPVSGFSLARTFVVIDI